MADTKYKDVASLDIGYGVDPNCERIVNIISLADKLMSPEGELASPFAAINDKTPPDVIHQHRYWLVELVMDGWNYEAFFTEQVQTAEATSRAIRQGADNDFIEYLLATLTKTGGTDTVTYESGRAILSGFHLSVTNRKGTKYQPCTVRFKVRGNRT